MKKYIKYIFLILYLASIAMIFMSSLETGKESSEDSSEVTTVIVDEVKKITDDKVQLDFDTTHFYVRKIIGHFGSFMLCSILGLLCFYLFTLKNKKAVIVSISTGLIVAVVSELLQLLSEGRSCEIIDMLIDYSGYLCGTIFTLLIICLIKKKKKAYN